MMRMQRYVWLAMTMAAGLTPAWAASFSCASATTPQEKLICADAKLSTLDSQAASAYRTLLRQLSTGAAGEVRDDQQAWVKWRDATCPDQHAAIGPSFAECLNEAYTQQLTMLRSWRRVDGIVFYPHLVLETVPEEKNMALGYADPGLGTGRFAWLNIDRPNAAQAAWNKAMQARVVAQSDMQMNAQPPPPVRFHPQGIKGGTFSVGTTLRAANARYISAEFDQYGYFYGGAHGGSQRIPFNWLVAKQRELQVDDIFGTADRWRRPFADLCWQRLLHGPAAGDLFINGDKMAQSFTSRGDVDKLSTTFADWLVDGSGITVLYGEYAIAPYAVGILSVHVGWNEVRPYLVAGFDPAALPQPLAETTPAP